jgi:hypothetical protein
MKVSQVTGLQQPGVLELPVSVAFYSRHLTTMPIPEKCRIQA